MNTDSRTRKRGFTLIEVLVALAIVALGLIGVFGQLSQSALAAGRLRDKTLADWVAINVLTELRLSGVFPNVGTQSDDIEMANTKWHYEMKISETEGGQLRRADVTVSFADKTDRPITVATGFVARRPKLNAFSDWAPPLVDEAGESEKSPPSSPPPARPPASGEAEQ